MGTTRRRERRRPRRIDVEFTLFVHLHEEKLRQALTASFGLDVGREATADSLAYGWEHWDRISVMENPIGYLYVVGRNRARRILGRRREVPIRYPVEAAASMPSFEPALAREVANLSERERTVVVLLHGYEWSMTEVAATLDVSKSTVQSYAERAMGKLRAAMGVTS